MRTGKPKGRPKGARNKKSIDFEQKLADRSRVIEQMVEDAFEGNSHDFLMSLYKDPGMPIETRIEAAKAALPYEKPRLASVEMASKDGANFVIEMLPRVAAL